MQADAVGLHAPRVSGTPIRPSGDPGRL